MNIAELDRHLKEIAFKKETDRQLFLAALVSMLEDKLTAPLVRRHRLRLLYQLLLSLNSPESITGKAEWGTYSKEPKLKNYFLYFQEKAGRLPPHPLAVNFFIQLGIKNWEAQYLVALLKGDLFTSYDTNRFQKLSHFYDENLKVLINFHYEYQETHTQEEKQMVFDMLEMMYSTSINIHSSHRELHQYLQEVLPVFVKRFEEDMPADFLYVHVDRLAEWFMVWRRHLQKEEPNIAQDDTYYEMDFSKIIKYVGKFLWWNNGLYYANGNKNYHFGSLAFIHLAKGGSMRNAPDGHPFTKKMAHALVNLPYDFNQSNTDMYLYCYGKSLGAGTLLSTFIQRFIRHSTNEKELGEELEKWNPIIQKLACEEFEQMDEAAAEQLMGYMYHGLRNIENFTVQRRSINGLIRASDAYYEDIAERARRRERERLRRIEEAERQQLNYEMEMERIVAAGGWRPSTTINEYRDEKYEIIELNTPDELDREGSSMSHCVGSYAEECRAGESTIWSLRDIGTSRRHVTIEVSADNTIGQALAKFNATPNAEHQTIIRIWAEQNRLQYY